jgi:hypothetical protein
MRPAREPLQTGTVPARCALPRCRWAGTAALRLRLQPDARDPIGCTFRERVRRRAKSIRCP